MPTSQLFEVVTLAVDGGSDLTPPASSSSSTMSREGPSSSSSSSSWECPACTYVNDNGRGLACVMCRTERRRPRRPPPERSSRRLPPPSGRTVVAVAAAPTPTPPPTTTTTDDDGWSDRRGGSRDRGEARTTDVAVVVVAGGRSLDDDTRGGGDRRATTGAYVDAPDHGGDGRGIAGATRTTTTKTTTRERTSASATMSTIAHHPSPPKRRRISGTNRHIDESRHRESSDGSAEGEDRRRRRRRRRRDDDDDDDDGGSGWPSLDFDDDDDDDDVRRRRRHARSEVAAARRPDAGEDISPPPPDSSSDVTATFPPLLPPGGGEEEDDGRRRSDDPRPRGGDDDDGRGAADDSETTTRIRTSEKEAASAGATTAAADAPGKKRDACRTCGTDLGRFATLKCRIAHAKRCSSRYGGGLFGSGPSSTRRLDGGGDDDAMMASDAHDDDIVVVDAEDDALGRWGGGVCGPAAAVDDPARDDGGVGGWHGDDGRRSERIRPHHPGLLAAAATKKVDDAGAARPEQRTTRMGRFFDAAPPAVRTLTSVLMAGARRVARVDAIASTIASSSSSSAAAAPKSGGGWRSSNRVGGGGGGWGGGSDNGDRRNGRCPAYKRITGTDFVCDGFQYACGALSGNYFLTHFHADHYGGIAKGWDHGTIYCSLPTANLVNQQLGVDKKYLHPLPMDEPTVIASKGKPVTVTLLNANHCPGAVMFLFEVGSRRILHVGDFRWDRELMMRVPQLRAFGGNSSMRLDELFLDTTYCNAKYTLPTQEDAIRAAIEVAARETDISKRDKSMKTLFLFGSYTIGKEKIYTSVAESLKSKVYVDSRRYRILSQIFTNERMRLFTTIKSETNLWVVPLGSVNFKQMNDYIEEGNKNKVFTQPYGRVVGFRPTGWTYSPEDKKQRKLTCGRPKPGGNLITSKTSGRFTVHGVPYSEHSSFPELVDCLACLRPLKIIPTVSVSKSEDQLKLLLNTLQGKNS